MSQGFRVEQWFYRNWPASAATPGAIRGISAPSSALMGAATAAFAAAGLACASSVAFASGTVTYAAAGISAPSSVAFGNEGEASNLAGLCSPSSVAFGDLRITYAASGLSAPSSALIGSAGSAGALAGLSAQSSVLYGDLQLVAGAGAMDGRSAPSAELFGSATATFSASGLSTPSSVLAGNAGVTGELKGLSVSATVAYGDLQLLAQGAMNGLSVASSVALGDLVDLTPPAPAPVFSQAPAGRKTRHLDIYRVRIDGQTFEFKTYEAAVAFLEQAKKIAIAQAQAHVKAVTERAEPLPALKKPVISFNTRELRAKASEATREIEVTYRQAMIDAEIAIIFAMDRQADDDEDAILILM